MGKTSKQPRPLKTLMRQGSESTVRGDEGLALKLIELATVDYFHPRDEFGRLDTIEFFLGDEYRKWLKGLGKPAHWLPVGIERADLERQRTRIRKGC